MIINDIVFGELEYDEFYWVKKEKESYNFFGNNFEVNITLNGKKNEAIKEIQRSTYMKYQSYKEKINILIEEAIYEYYKSECREYRLMFEEEADLLAPIITKKEELSNLVKLKGVIIEDSSNITDRQIIFLFNTTWDIEEGIGILLVNEKVRIIGGQSDVL